jgi:hypothetical protein
MKAGMRTAMGAAAMSALFALSPIHYAFATDFTESCAAGSGLLDDAGCKCLDGKVADSGDKSALLAYFKLQADVLKGKSISTSDATSAAMSKGTELMGKYSAECLK